MTQFTDYQEMLIAAGWIEASDLDEEYQDYLKRYRSAGNHPMDVLSYEQWKATWEEYTDSNVQYSEWTKTVSFPRTWDEQVDESLFFKELEWLECLLVL